MTIIATKSFYEILLSRNFSTRYTSNVFPFLRVPLLWPRSLYLVYISLSISFIHNVSSASLLLPYTLSPFCATYFATPTATFSLAFPTFFLKSPSHLIIPITCCPLYIYIHYTTPILFVCCLFFFCCFATTLLRVFVCVLSLCT